MAHLEAASYAHYAYPYQQASPITHAIFSVMMSGDRAMGTLITISGGSRGPNHIYFMLFITESASILYTHTHTHSRSHYTPFSFMHMMEKYEITHSSRQGLKVHHGMWDLCYYWCVYLVLCWLDVIQACLFWAFPFVRFLFNQFLCNKNLWL